MPDLEPPDSHYVSAAHGWLELGCVHESRLELLRVGETWREHPDVLEAWWVLHAHGEDWMEALDVARRLLQSAPERVSGWLHEAYCLRRVPGGGLPAAREVLLICQSRFSQEPTVLYNLACYDCQLEDLDGARNWLRQAFSVGDARLVRAMALRDADLQPLWEEIRKGAFQTKRA